MVQARIDREKLSFIKLKPSYSVEKFSCGDADLDAVPFYEKNGFRFMNAEDNDPHTRLMYYDLMDIVA